MRDEELSAICLYAHLLMCGPGHNTSHSILSQAGGKLLVVSSLRKEQVENWPVGKKKKKKKWSKKTEKLSCEEQNNEGDVCVKIALYSSDSALRWLQ